MEDASGIITTLRRIVQLVINYIVSVKADLENFARSYMAFLTLCFSSS